MKIELDAAIRANPGVLGLFQGETKFPQIAREWLKNPEHSLRLSTGWDDDDVHSLVALEFREGKESETLVYVPIQFFADSFPHLRPISDFVFEEERSARVALGVRNDELEEYLGFSLEEPFAFELQSALLTFDQVLRYGAMFAISNVGEASLSGILMVEPMEDERFTETSILSAHFSYQLSEPRHGLVPGFGEDLHCFRPGCGFEQ